MQLEIWSNSCDIDTFTYLLTVDNRDILENLFFFLHCDTSLMDPIKN